MARKPKTLHEATVWFWTHIVSDGDCWRWTATRNSDGYGIIWLSGKYWLAHRFSYDLHFGEIPVGLLVCHHCDTPDCVNPEHLFLGTQKDNMEDCDAKGRIRRGETHPCAKLTLADVNSIRDAINITQRELAKEFGVGRSTIGEIRTGKKWKCLATTAAAVNRNGRGSESKKG